VVAAVQLRAANVVAPAGEHLLHVRPLGLAGKRHVPDVVHVKVPVGPAERGASAVLAVPLELVDRAPGADGCADDWDLIEDE
jgi:hypothetical protein